MQDNFLIIYGDLLWRKRSANTLFYRRLRVSEEKLDKLKHAARLESYASYSEFIRRTALKETDKILTK